MSLVPLAHRLQRRLRLARRAVVAALPILLRHLARLPRHNLVPHPRPVAAVERARLARLVTRLRQRSSLVE